MSKLNGDSAWQAASRPLSLIRMLWKQKLAVVLTWFTLSAATIIVVLRLSPVYKAETVILVDSQAIPAKFVDATVSANLREQLATLGQQILSNARLWKIIETFNLYPEQRRDLPMQEVVQRMRSDLQVRVESGWSDERPGAFRVSMQGANPVVVAQVVNQLGGLFVEENSRTREMHAEGTLQFLQSQLDEAKKTLDEQEERVTEFKLKYNGELPEQEAALTASLAQLSVELQGNQDAISRAYSNQATLRSGLRVAQAVAEISDRLDQEPPENQPPASQSIQKPEDVRKAMEAELASLLTKYTDSYPRVQLLRAGIARLKALEHREQLASSVDPQHTEGLKMQLAAVDRELERRTQETQQLLQQIHSAQLHLSRIPIREQQMAALTRDYEISKTNYKSLLDKLNAAKLAAQMERRQKAERFTILEPAHPPHSPDKPNRPLLLEVGGVLSFAAALMLGLVREVKKNQVLGEWELPGGLLVYGRVPSIGSRATSGVRVRLQTRGRMPSLFRFLVTDGTRGGNGVAGDSVSKARAISPAKDPASLPVALGLQPALVLGAPVKRTVRSIRPDSPALWLHHQDPRALEQYRIARTRLEHDPSKPKLVVVTSACAGDGKSFSAVNLATVFAMRSNVQTLLVEADFRHSCLADLLGIPAQPGLSDVLSGDCELSDAIIGVAQLPNLCVLPAGTYRANITEMLGTQAWRSVCASFREQFAYTLFDTPPVGPLADYELIEEISDGVVLVVRPDHTDRSLFQIAQTLVSPDKMLGVLLNHVDDWFLWKTSASYYYGHPSNYSKR
jgi:protein tyrosine kinase modulator